MFYTYTLPLLASKSKGNQGDLMRDVMSHYMRALIPLCMRQSSKGFPRAEVCGKCMGQTGTLSLSSGCVNRSSMKLLTCSACRNCAQCQVPRQDC